jgi:hypothetical protein
MSRALWQLAALLVSVWCTGGAGSAASPDAASGLYQAKTRVTGQTVEGREPAIVRCFTDVLVKVSGDARMLTDPRVAALAKEAGTLVKDFRYRDLMADLPTNDEQGTRDRPYELTVTFDPAGIDAALHTLGRKPWAADRPRLAMFLSVRQGTVSYMLAADGSRGSVMREALAEAGERVGLRVLLPSQRVLDGSGLRGATWPAPSRQARDAAARSAGGDVAIGGRLLWSEAALGWIADWELAAHGRTYRWQLRGVSFDDAFRSAVRGAAQILSGHGAPK